MYKECFCSSWMIVTADFIDLLSNEYCILVVATGNDYTYYYVNNFAYCVKVKKDNVLRSKLKRRILNYMTSRNLKKFDVSYKARETIFWIRYKMGLAREGKDFFDLGVYYGE